MADSTLQENGMISISLFIPYLLRNSMSSLHSAVCLYCNKTYYRVRKDRIGKFCDRKCSFKINRYQPNEFWSVATEEQIKNRLSFYLDKHAIKQDGCWGWTGFLRDGYGVLSNGKNSLIGAHRASWIINYGNIPLDKIILHSCDNRSCTNPNHLRLGTHLENASDKYIRERDNHPSLENHKQSTLSNDTVLIIKDLLRQGRSPTQISRELKISVHCVYNIKYGKSWRGI